MSKDSDETSIKIEDGWNGLWIMIGALVIMFYGEPDLHDALMHRLADQPMPEASEEPAP